MQKAIAKKSTKTAVLFLALILLMSSTLGITAHAAEPRMTTIVPGLSIDGTTATCTARIAGNTLDEEMEAVICLYRANTLIATWTPEGNGYIFFSETKTVATGYLYTLVVTLTVDGETMSPVSVSAQG